MTVPFGSFDTPANGATGVTGAVPVTGWALDDVRVRKVEIYRNPLAGRADLSRTARSTSATPPSSPARGPTSRPPTPTSPSPTVPAGATCSSPTSCPTSGNGTTTLHAYASDDDGHATLLGSKTITCTNATATKPFGTIDTPGQGETVSGTIVELRLGADAAAGRDPDRRLDDLVYVDGAPAGHPIYNQYRSDIATLFPGYANSSGAVGYFALDTTRLANGMHTIAWLVTDDLGRADGIGSRYFWVQN